MKTVAYFCVPFNLFSSSLIYFPFHLLTDTLFALLSLLFARTGYLHSWLVGGAIWQLPFPFTISLL